MAEFRPALPYTTPIELIVPTYKTIKGVKTKVYTDTGIRLNCSFKTYGGTEQTQNDLYSVVDTVNIETWFREEIKSDCRIKVLATGAVYEILAEPENINMRNQYCKFKCRRVTGGA